LYRIIVMRYAEAMRTTLTLADDVAAAVERIRRERSIGLSEAVNELVRAGLVTHDKPPTPFRQTSHDLGRGVDFDNIADTLETLDGPSSS
jgi:hypothetical protein